MSLQEIAPDEQKIQALETVEAILAKFVGSLREALHRELGLAQMTHEGSIIRPSDQQMGPLDDEFEELRASIQDGESAVVVAAETGYSTGIRRKRYNHRGTDWNPLTLRQGTDRFDFTIPDGFVYSHYELKPIATTFPHELKVGRTPRPGASGQQSIEIAWKLWGLGQVTYEIGAVYHARGAAIQLEVIVGTAGWEQQVIQLIEQRKQFRLVVIGPDAARLWNDFLRFFSPATEAEPVVIITLAIITGVVALAGFLTLAYVLTLAINNSCNSVASYKPEAGVVGKLSFDINCRG